MWYTDFECGSFGAASHTNVHRLKSGPLMPVKKKMCTQITWPHVPFPFSRRNLWAFQHPIELTFKWVIIVWNKMWLSGVVNCKTADDSTTNIIVISTWQRIFCQYMIESKADRCKFLQNNTVSSNYKKETHSQRDIVKIINIYTEYKPRIGVLIDRVFSYCSIRVETKISYSFLLRCNKCDKYIMCGNISHIASTNTEEILNITMKSYIEWCGNGPLVTHK